VNVNARDISIKAGNNVETYATRLNASNNLRIEAGDQALYYAVRNETDHHDTTHQRRSWIGIRYDKSTEHSTTRISTPMVTHLYAWNGNLTSYSGGDQLYQGTVANYYSRDIQAGVGECARADARIILEGVKTEVFQQRTKESNYVVWQKQLNQGSRTETLTLPSFTGTVNTPFKAPGGITVQIPEGDMRSQIATLSQQPGMGYLNELAARNDVNWQPVKLAHDQWDFKQEGLTPAGAALVAVAVAWATGGMGASMMGTTGATTSAMANAAFASLAAQASITLINNKGDVAKTLKDLASSQTVKATIAAALTAGVLDGLSASSAEMRTISNNIKNGSAGFSEKLTFNLINASGRALTNTAINGGNLEDALRQALIGGLVDTAHGQAASKIGQASMEYVSHKLAHALAGCVAGAAAGGACKDGAIGGAVGEIVAEMFKGKAPAWNASEAEWSAFDAQMKAYGKLVAGAVSAYSGGNAQTAITTAEVAIDNNARMAMRQIAAMRDMTPPQLQAWMRAQSLMQTITANGGQVPANMSVPGARVNYNQSDIARLETQLRGVSPHHQLIFSQPSATLSPLPYSYVNPQTMVNMHNVPGATNTNAFGFPSSGRQYFRELLRTQPQMFSPNNQRDVLKGANPTVDAQWVQHNPTHSAFMRETLVHHHMMQGHIAVAIPTSVHKTWYSTLHPYR
jgi:filamentous hemagglutinin